jgi:hypothetical protein
MDDWHATEGDVFGGGVADSGPKRTEPLAQALQAVRSHSTLVPVDHICFESVPVIVDSQFSLGVDVLGGGGHGMLQRTCGWWCGGGRRAATQRVELPLRRPVWQSLCRSTDLGCIRVGLVDDTADVRVLAIRSVECHPPMFAGHSSLYRRAPGGVEIVPMDPSRPAHSGSDNSGQRLHSRSARESHAPV